jgi:hypothetical protein
MKKIMSMLALAVSSSAGAQDSSEIKNIIFSGYAEAYYSYDFNRAVNNTKPFFLYNFTRNNEVNLNLGYIKAAYSTEKVRANIALGTGTYMNANYSAEPGVLKNVYEGNAGIKFSRKKEIWLDAGIFSSHIGFESARGKDCWTLTRSLVAENTPYFETGVKISYTSKSGKWFLSGLLLNGWQHIQKADGNSSPAFGTQITFAPSARISVNYRTFIGNEQPDSLRQMRYYQNLYSVLQFSEHFGAIVSIDYGLQQAEKGSSRLKSLVAPVLILRYSPDKNNVIAARGEYYGDRDGLIVSSGTPNGFTTSGWSINYDRNITNKAVWRIEFRHLRGNDNYFLNKENNSRPDACYVTTSVAISF